MWKLFSLRSIENFVSVDGEAKFVEVKLSRGRIRLFHKIQFIWIILEDQSSKLYPNSTVFNVFNPNIEAFSCEWDWEGFYHWIIQGELEILKYSASTRGNVAWVLAWGKSGRLKDVMEIYCVK